MGTKDKKALPLFIDEEQLVTKAIEVLFRELGPVEASRFLALPKKRRSPF